MNPVGLSTTVTLGNAREIARWQWHVGEAGDPARLIEDFLADFGLILGGTARRSRVYGASLLVSAAAGARMIGGAVGAPSPAPSVPDVAVVVYGRAPAPEAEPAQGRWLLGPWEPSWTRQQHADAVEQVRAAIARGDVYQVNVVGHASAPYEGDPAAALHRLTRLPGARYGGVLGGEGWGIACASPETLISVRDGKLVTRPIKGTAPATAQGRADLRASPKERAEHVMIVDLARNDLAHVAVTGSVRVPNLFTVRQWSNLWQAESDVEARLRPDVGLASLLRAVCPGGSVTGAPKLAALAEIARLEPVG
ncbi:chorismate-binding protein, partial [Allorhizocola rhizosphaerae]|uniref:chorismate-binding protein n=1 Tax=Allorhizocola rhizosphaerae TaxID=1872709 RepID=UPI000E3D4426